MYFHITVDPKTESCIDVHHRDKINILVAEQKSEDLFQNTERTEKKALDKSDESMLNL